MKTTFASNTFRPRSFACGSLAGPTAAGPFRAAAVKIHQAGAVDSHAHQAGRQHPDHQHACQAGQTRRSVIPVP